jgi:hypothetical protein
MDDLGRLIKDVEEFKLIGRYDHNLYITYLYTLRAHSRGRIHASIRNKNKGVPHYRFLIYDKFPELAYVYYTDTLIKQATWLSKAKAWLDNPPFTKYDYIKLRTNFAIPLHYCRVINGVKTWHSIPSIA